MKGILLLSALAAVLIIPSFAQTDKKLEVSDDELEIRQFNKCPQKQYYEIFKSECMDCTPCKEDEFVVYKCSAFDNTICSTCDAESFRYTPAYFRNCKQEKIPLFGRYRMRDGMTSYGLTDKETPFKIITNDHLSALDSDESDDVDALIPLLPEPHMDDSEEEDKLDIPFSFVYPSEVDEDEDDDEKTLEFEDGDYDVIDLGQLLQPRRLVEDDESSSADDSDFSVERSFKIKIAKIDNDKKADGFNPWMVQKPLRALVESDSEESEEGEDLGAAKKLESELNKEFGKLDAEWKKLTNDLDDEDSASSSSEEDEVVSGPEDNDYVLVAKYTAADFLRSIKLALLSFAVVAVVLTLSLRCVIWCSSGKKERVFTVLQAPPKLTPEQENDLIRSLDYVKSKRQFKYEPLEEFV